jgi:hypothetical protein
MLTTLTRVLAIAVDADDSEGPNPVQTPMPAHDVLPGLSNQLFEELRTGMETLLRYTGVC